MAEGLNRVMLMGNLGADPELRYTQGGEAVLNMRLATTESYKDRNGERKEKTEWHNCVLWGKRAEALSKFLRKGSSMFVEGSLRNSSYEGKDGQKRYKTEINARNIILTGQRGSSRGGSDSGGYGAGAPSPEAYGGGQSAAGKSSPYTEQNDNDDLPF